MANLQTTWPAHQVFSAFAITNNALYDHFSLIDAYTLTHKCRNKWEELFVRTENEEPEIICGKPTA
jgi:hypothetical protein